MLGPHLPCPLGFEVFAGTFCLAVTYHSHFCGQQSLRDPKHTASPHRPLSRELQHHGILPVPQYKKEKKKKLPGTEKRQLYALVLEDEGDLHGSLVVGSSPTF
ncbi:hypothetical protein AbraIFM66950_009943 [Aspergillus brasiliensis]|nr:hypothetical protein AbraIFM66950_009943 [Aspergillus brasiliensis]